MILLTKVWSDLESYNQDRAIFFPSIPEMTEEEWVVLMGRYGSSHIRYSNPTQFKFAFFGLNKEAQEKMRAKLKVNERLRNLTEEEALSGDEIITNVATNPDTAPSMDVYEPLPYVSNQTGQKETRGKVAALYNWKHSLGGQAYNEWLDTFRALFRVILQEEVDVYGQ